MTDCEIVCHILERHETITREYMYRTCYPMFKSIYNQYYTNCETCSEFINEIYVYIMTPNPNTGLCKLQTFGFRCTLRRWLQVVTKNYCIHLFKKRNEAAQSCPYLDGVMNDSTYTLGIDLAEIAAEDIDKLLSMMGNLRYREIIRHRYVED